MAGSVAYLGPAGTFTEQAVHLHNPDAVLHSFTSIHGVALAVVSGIVDEGVVPIENSLQGSVNETLDILISQRALFIRRELVLPIEHCLLVTPDTHVPDIEVIYSHPQALGQCREFLERCFPNAQLVASLSTSAAVADMKQSKHTSAAIAPFGAAALNNVRVMAKNIQDNDSNVTRFVVLADRDSRPTGWDKTSICFSFAEDKPGLLYEAFGEFVRRNINLAKVESRPSKHLLGEYIFLVDVDGHREEPDVKEAIDALKQRCSMFRIFGSYPQWSGSDDADPSNS